VSEREQTRTDPHPFAKENVDGDFSGEDVRVQDCTCRVFIFEFACNLVPGEAHQTTNENHSVCSFPFE
jgi:hypothetical protein